MTSLHLDTLRMPGADLGPLNPLPPLVRSRDPHEGIPPEVDDADMLARINYGRLSTMLPYRTQDAYNRERVDCDFPIAVLENDVLQATFLLSLGGRLWSIIHKPTGRELLYKNSVFQPANLALRNAWFAGGAEWNLGTTGHTALTCEPLHAVRVEDSEGTPVLRLYEYERSRELVFSIDFSLPEGSSVLLATVRVTNPSSMPVPLYWWTNIAVPEDDDIRVIAPVTQAFHFGYDRGLHVAPVPVRDGRDVSYPVTAKNAEDWFFDCQEVNRPWVAAVDGAGKGLLHVSTNRLIGRKLFAWGHSIGGRNWQQFLCGTGERYLEVQGGLAATQFEHEQLPAGETCTWVEAFGFAEVDETQAHGNWAEAQRAVEIAADALAPSEQLEGELVSGANRANQPPVAVLSRGSGWGALEEHRRKLAGEPPLGLLGTPFSADTLGPEQQQWLELLSTGSLPTTNPDDEPQSYLVSAPWRSHIEAASDSWEAWLHRGIVQWYAGDVDAAYAATVRSVEEQPTAWALRNLGMMDREAGRLEQAVQNYRAARELAPGLRPLLIETLTTLVEAGLSNEALLIIDSLGADELSLGRIRLIELQAALDAGELERARDLFEHHNLVPDDIQEGEDSLSTLWSNYHALLGTMPVPEMPAELDYRLGDS